MDSTLFHAKPTFGKKDAADAPITIPERLMNSLLFIILL